ncbi:uncharacterized protein CXorf49 homolog [Sorex araneus]|uniref:uncharacterized protein CXorf49 homolog n=1 Tax=Sorex araneus TaxID=42254 RepID=UPI0024338F18|nr:uncharacterized protein CXorf49 homolog [Sorex araneus]
MRSPDDVPLASVSVGPEGGQQAGASGRGPRSPPGNALGRGLGVPLGGEGESRRRGTQSLELRTEGTPAGEAVRLDRERRLHASVSNVTVIHSDDGDPQVTGAETATRSEATTVNKLFSTEVQSAAKNRPLDNSQAEASERWMGFQTGTRGAWAQRHVEVPPASIPPGKIGVAQRGQIWRVHKSSSRGRWDVPRGRQWCHSEGLFILPSDHGEKDESGEMQAVKMNVYAKEGQQASSRSTEIPRDTTRPVNFSVQKKVCFKPNASVRSPPQGSPTAVEKQSVANQAAFVRFPNVVWGRGQGKPTYSRDSATCSPPAAKPKIVIQEKNSPGDNSKLNMGRALPSWGQRVLALPSEPTTFAPISGAPMFGTTKRYFVVPPQSKQPKNICANMKKIVIREPSESEQVASEDDDSNQDPTPMGQMLATRLKLSGQSIHLAEGSSGSLGTSAHQTQGNGQATVVNQEDMMIKESPHSGEFVGFFAVAEDREEVERHITSEQAACEPGTRELQTSSSSS